MSQKTTILQAAQELELFILEHKILFLPASEQKYYEALSSLQNSDKIEKYKQNLTVYWTDIFPVFYRWAELILSKDELGFFRHYLELVKTQLKKDDTFRLSTNKEQKQLLLCVINYHGQNVHEFLKSIEYTKLMIEKNLAPSQEPKESIESAKINKI